MWYEIWICPIVKDFKSSISHHDRLGLRPLLRHIGYWLHGANKPIGFHHLLTDGPKFLTFLKWRKPTTKAKSCGGVLMFPYIDLSSQSLVLRADSLSQYGFLDALLRTGFLRCQDSAHLILHLGLSLCMGLGSFLFQSEYKEKHKIQTLSDTSTVCWSVILSHGLPSIWTWKSAHLKRT